MNREPSASSGLLRAARRVLIKSCFASMTSHSGVLFRAGGLARNWRALGRMLAGGAKGERKDVLKISRSIGTGSMLRRAELRLTGYVG